MSGVAMTEDNRFASLGPMLLARKGTAKPAMRAQLGEGARMAELSDDLDDLANSQDALGWNDMGEDVPAATSVVTLPVANKRQPITPAKIASESKPSGKRSAFTLRLDAERHLKMRLASTMQNCSSQTLVTQALDAFLADIPELDTLAAQMRHTNNKS